VMCLPVHVCACVYVREVPRSRVERARRMDSRANGRAGG